MEKNKFIEELFYELSCQLGKEFENETEACLEE